MLATVEGCLQRIAKLNPKLNAFITVLADGARAQAKTAPAGPLHGVPIGIKDMFDTAGIRTTAASARFKDRIPTKDAVAVTKLKDAGAIVVGKTNMHELAMGTTSVVSYFGAVHNPWNLDHIAGGSSGGSAAAVASGMCFASLDTDAIGSCRLPASCCGVVGFKGTYGLIDIRGILDGEPVDPTILWLAHVAVTACNVADVALVLNVLAEGTRPADYTKSLTDGGTLRLGVVTNFKAAKDVVAAFGAAVKTLHGLGFTTTDATVPFDRSWFDVRAIEAHRKTVVPSLFKNSDLLVLPTTIATTPTIADAAPDPTALSPANTIFANYYGLPAITVPCGRDQTGLPLGLQIVGKPWDEAGVLHVAHRYQTATSWGLKQPIG